MLWDIIYANIGVIWLGWETHFNHSILNLCNLWLCLYHITVYDHLLVELQPKVGGKERTTEEGPIFKLFLKDPCGPMDANWLYLASQLTSNGHWKNAGCTRQVGVSQPLEAPDLSMGSEAWSKHRRFPDQWRLAEERREPHQWRSDHGQKLQMVRGHVSRIKVTLLMSTPDFAKPWFIN